MEKLTKVNNDLSAYQGYSKEDVDTIKNTVAKDATDSELRMFLAVCKNTGLDPFLKEVFFSKNKTGRVMLMTSRDGYLKIANLHPDFEGINSDFVCEKDHFQTRKLEVEHTYGQGDRGKVVGAYCIVYRKGRIPCYQYVPLSEYYNANSEVWRSFTSSMIKKVAEAMALKRSFAISGLVTQEELSEHEEPVVQHISHTEVKPLEANKHKPMTGKQMAELKALAAVLPEDRKQAFEAWIRGQVSYDEAEKRIIQMRHKQRSADVPVEEMPVASGPTLKELKEGLEQERDAWGGD